MDGPFFRSYWNQPSRPRHSPSVRGIPVQRNPLTATTSSPKVVSIPVHFVGSEETRSASALKIQKVFRGFLVRKSVKRIASIKREVDEVERRISQPKTVELLRRDARERLRVNETLMALLFKLDSVLGVDSGVRDCRKAVIKKAIALQERVDDIVSGNQEASSVETTDKSDVLAEAADRSPEIRNSMESLVDSVNQSLEIEGNQANVSTDCDQVSQTEVTVDVDSSVVADSGDGVEQFQSQEVEAPAVYDAVDVINDRNRSENVAVCCPDAPAPVSTELEAMSETKDDGLIESVPEICENNDFTEVGVDSEVKVDNETWVVKQMVEDKNVKPVNECIEGSVETTPTDYSANPMNLIEAGDEHTSRSQDDGFKEEERAECTERNLKDCEMAKGREDEKRSSDLMERMMEDNQKMMSMMTQLFEKNEIQTRMLTSLTQRVEQLEKAFICDRLRRKKKRNAVGTDDDLESCPDQKKCGKQ